MDRKTPVIVLVLLVGILPVLWYVLNFDQLSPLEVDDTVRYIPLLDQTAVVITAFVIKPLYMLISLVLVWKLRNSRSPELTSLYWGLLAFFIGEAFCSINYLFYQDTSIFSEYLHNLGMVVSFGFIIYALWEGVDSYLIQYSHPKKRCSLIGLCSACIKNQDVPCRLHQIFQLLILVLSILALIPLSAEIQETSYNTYIFNTLYTYRRYPVHQIFEIRYCPIIALVMLISTFLILQRSKERNIPYLARVLFAAGFGALGFGSFRLFFNSVFSQDLSWAASWEEITEFILMAVIAYFLWLFRKPLELSIGKT